MIFRRIFLLISFSPFFLVISNCATSPTHVGVQWGRSTGPVSSMDARKADKFVSEFHSYLRQEHWQAVYDALDRNLQSNIARRDLENAFTEINHTFGSESKFGPLAADPTEFLHRQAKLGYSDPKHTNALVYYDAIVGEYKSTRTIGDLVYFIGVSLGANNSDDLKVSSIQIYRAIDVENKNTHEPVFAASVASPKIMP